MLFQSVCITSISAMTLSPKLTKLLNEQINNEMASSYVYLGMAAWFEQTPYSGFAQWMGTTDRSL